MKYRHKIVVRWHQRHYVDELPYFGASTYRVGGSDGKVSVEAFKQLDEFTDVLRWAFDHCPLVSSCLLEDS